jgi:limonene-1,2-epoxide hydrolase
MSPVETVVHFLETINQHDADKLAALMTEDHQFIDSLGQTVNGRESMRLGWRGYFAFCPDYWAAGGTIAADGKLPAENKWRTSAAWLALVDGDLIKQWRVYADNKPVYDIMARSKLRAGA